MRVNRQVGAERAEDVDLGGRVRHVVIAPDHVCDPVGDVVDRAGEVVGRAPVGADDHRVGEVLVRELDPAAHRVVPGDRPLVRHPEADRALVEVCLALGDQPLAEYARIVHPVELEADRTVPVDAEPAQRLLDLLDRLLDLAARVRVLDPQQAFAPLLAREEPVEEEGPHASDVQESGRARRHADSDGHRLYRKDVSALPRRLLRIEGLAVAVGALTLYFHLGFGWVLLVVLVLLPDLSMLGYLAGPRAGALAYNLAHTELWPIGLAVAGILADVDLLVQIALVWLVHIGTDRLLGYGFKYPTAFTDTHLQRV